MTLREIINNPQLYERAQRNRYKYHLCNICTGVVRCVDCGFYHTMQEKEREYEELQLVS